MKTIAAALCVCTATVAFADEGMWTFDNFPSAAVQAKYGVTIDKAWLDHVRAGAVRVNGCSASLVSGDGLVLTNNHCVVSCSKDLSNAQNDYVKDGFSAAARKDERKCPGEQAEILESNTDVTARINAATAGKSGQAYVQARTAAIAVLEKESCAGKEYTHRCQVISLYDGGVDQLYTYRRYTDVRLVFAPEFQTAFFGGDPDNFNFPRYDLDFAYMRLYENDAPVKTPQHLTWNPAAPKAGETVFIAGNPGGTNRQLTETQLLRQRDVTLPMGLAMESELRGRYSRYAQESAEHARRVNDDLFYLENGIKVLRGQHAALTEPSLIAAQRKAETDLKAKIAANPKLAAETGDPWGDIDKALAASAALYHPYTFLEARAGGGSSLFGYARTLVRGAEEREKPNGERMPNFGDARLAQVERGLVAPRPVEMELEQLKLEFWLSKLREFLTADAPETALALGKDSPETLARKLTQSKLADPALRKALWEGGEKAIEASKDPLILYVRKIDARARELRKAYEDKVTGPIDRASERIAHARFQVYGTSVYPDATFSLRLSYGKIAGWNEPGKTIPPFTVFSGLFVRATGQPPFDLTARWAGAESKLNPNTVFDISSDNDIVGGNSGSPLLNAKGEVIGAVFDGNIHSLGGNYFFDPAMNRTVSVSTAAVTEALAKLYGRPDLIAELSAP